MLDRANILIPCPNCGRKTSKPIGWIKTHSQFRCLCGTPIHLKRDQFLGEIRKADRALADFKRSLNRIGKR